MTINDRITALIRTVVPYLWAAALTWLFARFPFVESMVATVSDWADQDVTAALGLLFVGLVLTGYYSLARWAGARWPWLEAWLVGRSVVPVYVAEPSYVIPKGPVTAVPDDERAKRTSM